MFDIRGYFKKRAEGKIQEAEKAREAIRLAFTNRYLNFKTLLSLNDKVLEMINEMEQALVDTRPFGLAFIRSRCTALAVSLYKIIQLLNEITDQQHRVLFEVFDRLRGKIDQELKKKRRATQGEWVLSLETVTKELADQAGNKMAHLGEVKSRLGLPVPEGFIITAAAYEFFMESIGLRDEINRRLQSLEVENLAQLHETSAEIQKLIVRSELPAALARTILSAHQDLQKKAGGEGHVSMRSSASGEDGQEASFAGQYRSILNVSPEYLLFSYKEIVASKYSVPAMAYRLHTGFLDEDIFMGVGCMTMIQARAAGVMYTSAPTQRLPEGIFINAVWGLGKGVVDGSLAPDLFVLDRKNPRACLQKEIHPKEKKMTCHPEEGISLEPLPEAERDLPAITEEEASRLAEMALRLENHFGIPQDIEWAIDAGGTIYILQTRPLSILKEKEGRGIQSSPPAVDLPVLVEGGVTASPGKACGPAFLVETSIDMLQFQEGAILLARTPRPQWAPLLNKAAAVITDQGALTGHLAAVAREFKIPALMGVSMATRKIHSGDLITLDADRQRVYAGKAEVLLADFAHRSNPMKGKPVYRMLEAVLTYIAPLQLTDPESPQFAPEGCQTLHDIIRFAHEIALRELFDDQQKVTFPEKAARKLIADLPMEWWVLDLEGGIRERPEGPTVRIEDITSIPLLALWEGLKSYPWKGPPAVDTGGFLSILAEATMNPSLEPRSGAEMAGKNYLIVSRDFFHLSTHLGFHFSTVEAFLGERVAENYVWFYFKGGGGRSGSQGNAQPADPNHPGKVSFLGTGKRGYIIGAAGASGKRVSG